MKNKFIKIPVVNLNLFGMTRIFFYSSLLLFYQFDGSLNLQDWLKLSQAQFWEPISLFNLFSLDFWLIPKLNLILNLWKVSMAACALGIFFRMTSIISFITFFYLTALPLCFGKVHHAHHCCFNL